uniref:Troponin I type 2b (skeletal, fast), tandem duplicate 1 n=1 Tax=Astatotilapia calliptera TaxID=8154 RepID=A0A3P8P9X7_ASTCA
HLVLQVGQEMLEEEAREAEREKMQYLEENCTALFIPGSMQDLQELCCKLHKQIDLVDEERYNMEVKVAKSNKVDDLKLKIQYLNGRFKKPVLKKVRMSADAMLAGLLGSKHKVSMDLRASLKQVKKEVKDEVGKKIKDKTGMGGRKKMFDTEP